MSPLLFATFCAVCNLSHLSEEFNLKLLIFFSLKLKSFDVFFPPHLPPVHADGQEREHVEGDRHVGHVVVDLAVERPEDPDSVPHEDEGGDGVEGGHEEVRHGQVHQEVVGHAPHGAVG